MVNRPKGSLQRLHGRSSSSPRVCPLGWQIQEWQGLRPISRLLQPREQ